MCFYTMKNLKCELCDSDFVELQHMDSKIIVLTVLAKWESWKGT